MNNIRMVLCDLDGTLLNNHKTVSPHTRETIVKMREKGILFGVATGRSLFALERLLEEWNIKDLADVQIGFNGAQIRIPSLGVDEMRYQLSGESCLDIIDHLIDLPVNFSIYDHNDLYAYKEDQYSHMLSSSNHFTHRLMGDLKEFFQGEFPKLVVMTDEDKMDALIERSKTFSSENYHCFRTGPVLFEYVDRRISKTSGIQRVCEHISCTMENVCVFGDAENDLDMLKNAGLGVCMKNGSDSVKKISDDITDLSNDEDGVADYIEKHFI